MLLPKVPSHARSARQVLEPLPTLCPPRRELPPRLVPDPSSVSVTRLRFSPPALLPRPSGSTQNSRQCIRLPAFSLPCVPFVGWEVNFEKGKRCLSERS